MKKVDLIIDAKWVLTVDDANTVHQDHSIVINDKRILKVVPSASVAGQFQAVEHVKLPHHVVLPGFVNAHTHAAMTLLRGFADDYSLQDWLNNHIWPTENKYVSREFVSAGTLLAFAEMIKSGTTCMNDMYYFPDIVGELAERHHLRASLGLIALEFPTVWAATADQYIDNGLEVLGQFQSSDLISCMWAPHAPYTVSDNTFNRLLSEAEEHDLGIHMHVHETAQEVKDSLAQSGLRPIERLRRLDLINSRLSAVHMTQLEDQEIELLAEHKTNVIHCPKSNLKLASGICPVTKLQQHGVNVALGTDGAASNNNLDMFEEMRFAALIAKGNSLDAETVNSKQAIRMATINGAKSVGVDSEIGSLEAGKFADITAVDIAECQSSPLYDPASHIVYSCSKDQVSDVWIGGKRVLENRELHTIDEQECLSMVQVWQSKLAPHFNAGSTD